MRLSIVVPVYNERFLVGEMLSRLLRVEIPQVTATEIIAVDDGSTDGSGEVLDRFAAAHPGRLRVIHLGQNQGKGAALRAGIDATKGDLVVVQDADLEYDPNDLRRLVTPFVEDGADVVYGSRFLTSERRRVLYFRHTLGNRLITFLSNWFTDLNLTDVETCYKMFKGPLLRSLPIRSNDFRVEIELTAKVAKRHCRVFEVPISYSGRTYREGKKIGWRDGFKALTAILRFWVIDDLYKEDRCGADILHALERANRFNAWMADAIRPWMGAEVLEIGAGIGNLTRFLTPRDKYVASDISSVYLEHLDGLTDGRPYLDTAVLDLDSDEGFDSYREAFDTVVCLNVLEHVKEPLAAVERMMSVLRPGGRLVVYVPAWPALYGSLDEALDHRCRYTKQALKAELDNAGLKVLHIAPFNRASTPSWWFNSRILRRKSLGRIQLKIFDTLVPILRRCDRFLPLPGLGYIAVGERSQ
jgi:glycosyltransferase involved in cell wall biosynthesis